MLGRPYAIKFILYSTLVVTIIFCSLLAISYFLVGNGHVLPRLIAGALVLLYVGATFGFLRHKMYKSTGMMILAMYLSVALATAWSWGINAPVAILLLCFVILLSSVMFGPKYILPSTALVIMSLALIQIAVTSELSTPDTTALSDTSTFADVAVYSVVFGIFAIIGWVSGAQLQRSFQALQKAQNELKQEKENVESKLSIEKERLRSAQLEEQYRLYEFAELGQYTTIVLHDLSNQVAALSLAIKDQAYDDTKLFHPRQAIVKIEELIKTSNRRISAGTSSLFHPHSVIEDKIYEIKEHYAKERGRIVHNINKKLRHSLLYGDPDRFAHIINILLTNAVQASVEKSRARRSVVVSSNISGSSMLISFRNKGMGIPSSKRKHIFTPFSTSKATGHGIGLYIAKKIIEDHFSGTIQLASRTDLTEFIIKLPIKEKSAKRPSDSHPQPPPERP